MLWVFSKLIKDVRGKWILSILIAFLIESILIDPSSSFLSWLEWMPPNAEIPPASYVNVCDWSPKTASVPLGQCTKKEIKLLQKCMDSLEKEMPLCDVQFDEPEKEILNGLMPFSLKPTVQLKGKEDINTIIQLAMEKADYMFFYTSHPRETHAWFVPKGTDIISCAGKIHSDLARGFIKGDVVSYQDYLHHHNFNDCKTKGIAKTVEKNYIVQPNEIIEIRFNV